MLILNEPSRHRVPLIASSQGNETKDDKPGGNLELAVLTAIADSVHVISKKLVTARLPAARNRWTPLGRPASAIHDLFSLGLEVRAIVRELNLAASSLHSIVQGRGRRSNV